MGSGCPPGHGCFGIGHLPESGTGAGGSGVSRRRWLPRRWRRLLSARCCNWFRARWRYTIRQRVSTSSKHRVSSSYPRSPKKILVLITSPLSGRFGYRTLIQVNSRESLDIIAPFATHKQMREYGVSGWYCAVLDARQTSVAFLEKVAGGLLQDPSRFEEDLPDNLSQSGPPNRRVYPKLWASKSTGAPTHQKLRVASGGWPQSCSARGLRVGAGRWVAHGFSLGGDDSAY